MDRVDQNSTQVSGQPGSWQGQPMAPNESGDVGADLDSRLNERIEQIANGFRSTIDRRLGTVERFAQTVPTLEQRMTQMQQQLSQVAQYFSQAQEADLDPEDRRRLQEQREQTAWQEERQRLIHNARQQNAAFKVRDALAEMGYLWNDERLDWAPTLYESDPDAWASTVLANATRSYAAQFTQNQQTAQQNQRRREQEITQRTQVEGQNAQRALQASQFETGSPGGPQASWHEKARQMTVQERRDFLNRQLHRLRHGEISQPWQ